MIKIIYIAGDGRSGSTLLDAVLSNIEGSISVGECHRFWVRYPENASRCACASLMQDCELWRKVDQRLHEEFQDYDPIAFEKKVREIQYYRNFEKIPALLDSKEWQPFLEVVTAFYTVISEVTQRNCIIDSSKSMSWGYVLQHIESFDVRLIHLERNLPAVANSWKKTIRLPEYTDAAVFMPKKGNKLITKTWLKIKWMGRKLKKRSTYYFLRYQVLTNNPKLALKEIAVFVDEAIPIDALQILPSHAIGGNPMRSSMKKLEIKEASTQNELLSGKERFYFKSVHLLAKLMSL